MPAVLLDGGPLRVWNLSECQRKLGIVPGGGINQLTGDVTAGPGTGSQVATIAPAAVTLAKLQDFNTDKLIGRDTAGTGPAEAIGVTGGIEFTGTQNIQIADDGVTYAKMQNISAASRLLGRGSAAGAGDPQEITLGPGLSMVGTLLDAPAAAGGITELTGDVTAGPGSGSQVATIANATVTDAKLRDSIALSVIGNISNSAGVPGDIPAVNGSDSVLRESGGFLAFGFISTAGIGAAAVTNAKLRNSGALSVIGRSANSAGVPADLSATAASGAVLRESGSVLGFGTIATAGITDAAVTSAKLRDSGALSIIGRSANSAGVPADISASAASGAVLRESGSVVGFGTIVAAGIASNAVTTAKILDANVTNAKLANVSTATFKGRTTAGTGVPEDLTATQATALLNPFTDLLKGLVPASGGGTSTFLRADATFAAPPDTTGITQLTGDVTAGPGSGSQAATIASNAVTTAKIADDAVTNAKLANMAGNTIKGNNSGATVDPVDLTATEVTAMLNPFTSLLQGLVPQSGGGTTNFLRADGSWTTAPDTGITQLTGDVTAGAGSGSQAATIANDAVTFAKMQNLNTDRLMGRDTAGSGDPEEIGLGTGGLEFTGSSEIRIANGAVTNARLANMATLSIKGNNTGAPAVALDLTQAQVAAMLNTFTDLLKGVVPASGGGTSNFLRADGIFAAPPDTGITQLTGDVVAGPGSGSVSSTISASVVNNAKMVPMPDQTVKGNASGSATQPQDLTVAQLKTMLGISKQTEVDFGATPVSEALFTVTDASVSATSKLTGTVAYEAPTGKDLDELDMDGLDLKFGPGSGQFTVYVRGMDGYIADKFKLNYIVG